VSIARLPEDIQNNRQRTKEIEMALTGNWERTVAMVVMDSKTDDRNNVGWWYAGELNRAPKG
jgi:hypothetical protein